MFSGILKNKKSLFILGLVIFELILMFFNGMRFNRNDIYEISQENLLVCDNLGNYTPGFYADHSFIEGSYIATSPLFLAKGIYDVTVDYTSNSENNWHTSYTTMTPEYDISKEKTANLLYCDKTGIPAELNRVSYLSWVRYGTDYRVTIGPERDASGDGIYVLADKVTITYLRGRTILFEESKLFLFFLIIDILLYVLLFKKSKAKSFIGNGNEIILAGLLFIIGFSSYPLLNRELYFGDDIFYHLRRVAYLAEGLKGGAFPVKIQPGWDNNYGYAVGVCYGDLLLYPSAILIALGCTVQFGYKFYIFLTNVLTTFISYHAYKKMSGNKYIGLICSGLFTLMGFRLHSIYSGATVGEFGAYTFLPLVILGLYEIYQNGAQHEGQGGFTQDQTQPHANRRFSNQNRYGYITLALGITLTLSSHVLSTLILAIVIPLFCLIMLEKTIKKEVMLPLLKAFCLTVVLNLYFVIPCAEYLLFQDMRGNTNFDILWGNGQQLVNLLVNLDDPSLNSGGWSGIGFYSLLILALAAGTVLTGKFKEKTGSYLRVLLLMFGLIFLSTNSIVYYWLKYNAKPVYDLLGNLQFPWHFLDVSCGLIVFFAAKVFEIIFREDGYANAGSVDGASLDIAHRTSEKKYIGIVLSAIVAMLCISQSGDLIRETIVEGNPITQYSLIETNVYGSKEFAINNIDRNLALHTEMVVNSELASADIIRRSGTTIYAQVSNPSEETVVMEAPLWGYRHYAAKAGAKRLSVSMSENKKLAVEIPAGFDGQIKIYFHEPWYWRVAEIFSLLALAWALKEIFPVKILRKVRDS